MLGGSVGLIDSNLPDPALKRLRAAARPTPWRRTPRTTKNSVRSEPRGDGDTSVIGEGAYEYCDGHDGEILMGVGSDGYVKLETIHRDDAPIDRMVRVTMEPATECEDAEPLASLPPVDLYLTPLEAFFGWQQEEYTDLSDPDGLPACADDPFDTFLGDPSYDVDSLECLEGSGERLRVVDIPEGETRFQSWEVRYSDGQSAKKDGLALRAKFAGDRGGTCPLLPGDRPSGLPVAVHCDDDIGDDGSCDVFSFRTFRFCMADYDPARGGNWHFRLPHERRDHVRSEA
jgi:hypothetical protein